MREPGFWHRAPGWQAALLAPLAALYGAVAARRMGARGTRADVPVICVGNFHMGGAGKTQLARHIAARLKHEGLRPVFLSRGYGGSLPGPVVVNEARHRPAQVGDEPLLLAADAPVVVARNRASGARAAGAIGDVIIMDDGFQNPSLEKDLSVIVVDAARGLGNGRVFPAGPLRAPLADQLARTDLLVVIGEGTGADPLVVQARARAIPVLTGRIVPDPQALARLKDKPLFAFAGIGDPLRFLRTLQEAGLNVVRQRWFADHHAFSVSELSALVTAPKAEGLQLVTTEKDLARIGRDFTFARYVRACAALPVRLVLADEAAFDAAILSCARRAPAGG